ncbi:predicted protein [Sclerotinia sclerotiorum 1980 UF-70]|uniref:Uncharacterized protein n=1 Tax=Sclerotinia sclerotiorum (strain ATCC 18683 / 1980 / Ss-1) TaxID=665079 RepID=A7ED74_SCLS1|nr:predicted protein [Sclerotinia sclerotiorum 1980 UF-70]EDO00790.1 predicted protein [Sclerotinia sclerotiorum 1980 UF-70]
MAIHVFFRWLSRKAKRMGLLKVFSSDNIHKHDISANLFHKGETTSIMLPKKRKAPYSNDWASNYSKVDISSARTRQMPSMLWDPADVVMPLALCFLSIWKDVHLVLKSRNAKFDPSLSMFDLPMDSLFRTIQYTRQIQDIKARTVIDQRISSPSSHPHKAPV